MSRLVASGSKLAVVVLGGLLLAVAACGSQPASDGSASPRGAEVAPPPPSSDVVPSGNVEAPPLIVDEEDVVVVEEEEEVVVVEEGETETVLTSNPARQRDIEDCYAYATAQVARDAQVQKDRAPLFAQFNSNPTYVWTSRMDAYGNEKRRGKLFDSCMAAKGYADY